jgi:hydrogenase nickel incorporation protein HypA/HybF
MHEIALCEGVLSVALEASVGQPVKRVRVRVGRLQAVVPEVFTQGWEMVTDGTAAAGSSVELVDVPIRVNCPTCHEESDATETPLACMRCGSPNVTVVRGDELLVEEVEMSGGAIQRNPALAGSREEG